VTGQTGNVVAFPTQRMGTREPWITRQQLALELGMSVRWIDYRITEGMPSRKLRGARRFRLTEVEAWLRQKGWAA
jgi:predicted DNA-binding transcriptional regulator AlpA